MNKLFTISFLIIFYFSAFAQNPNDDLFVNTGGGGMRIKNIKAKPKATKGTYYYVKNWRVGTIKLFSGEVIENYPLKYDMKMNQIDIKVDEEIKALSIGSVKEIAWTKSNGDTELLKNARIYNKNEHGLLSIINNGNTPLLKKTSLKIQESNYNAALDVGNQAKKYIKTEEYYTISNGNLKKTRKSKRSFNKLFSDKTNIVKTYVKQNNLSYKKDNDLAKIFEYYNSL